MKGWSTELYQTLQHRTGDKAEYIHTGVMGDRRAPSGVREDKQAGDT